VIDPSPDAIYEGRLHQLINDADGYVAIRRPLKAGALRSSLFDRGLVAVAFPLWCRVEEPIGSLELELGQIDHVQRMLEGNLKLSDVRTLLLTLRQLYA
jgi:hypothetical protein